MDEAWIFNDWQTWESFREGGGFSASETVYTDHPYLFEKLSGEGRKVQVPADLVDDASERELAAFAGKLVRTWQGALDVFSESGLKPVKLGTALGRPFFSFVNSILFRAVELEKILARHGSVVVPFLSGDARNRPETAMKALNSFNCNYYALLSLAAGREGIFARVRAEALPSSLEGVSRRHNHKESVPGRAGYLQLLMLRLFAQRSQLGAKWRARFFSSPLSGRSRARIWIYLESAFIQRTLPALFRAGFSAKNLNLPERANAVDAGTGAETVEAVLIGAYEAALEKNRSGALDAAVRSAARRTALYVANHLAPIVRDTCRRVDAWRSGIGPGRDVIFSNSLCEPEEAVLEQVMRDRGVPLIAFEHGVKGLTKVDETVGDFTDQGLCSGYVAHSQWEVEFYGEDGRAGKAPIFVNGIADLTAPESFGISRLIGRNFLRQPRGRKLVLYAPTRFREDNVWIGCETRDVDYWRFIKEMVFSVFAVCDGDVFVKLHQKGWLPGQKAVYDLRKHPLEAVELPKNVRYGAFPQLNYIRWSADVIVIDRATSTIQWALTREIPLVYLDLPSNPLKEKAREAMSDSAFVVDVAGPDWKDELKWLLNLPVAELKRQWEAKRNAREEFLEGCVWGPRFDGAAFAEWLGNFVRPGRLDP